MNGGYPVSPREGTFSLYRCRLYQGKREVFSRICLVSNNKILHRPFVRSFFVLLIKGNHWLLITSLPWEAWTSQCLIKSFKKFCQSLEVCPSKWNITLILQKFGQVPYEPLVEALGMDFDTRFSSYFTWHWVNEGWFEWSLILCLSLRGMEMCIFLFLSLWLKTSEFWAFLPLIPEMRGLWTLLSQTFKATMNSYCAWCKLSSGTLVECTHLDQHVHITSFTKRSGKQSH